MLLVLVADKQVLVADGRPVAFLLVTFDPVHDTPALSVLHQFLCIGRDLPLNSGHSMPLSVF